MRVRVVLACSRCERRNYITSKDRARQPERMERKKFCSACNGHTVHRETR
ncbi:MAG: 50S ribosomal protein L33 [Gemmatimonadota bacterium]|nr:50S ribosomal protein L33 [Gemmatimonadota bacterium]MDP6461478.1 50S ribosomal protein L33 [Gemmatimonadota bacterium]MDP6530127.1 50S ribosomal protein L33 [Gemmatimonadota bacterium]MDP6803614.1 50S ribosomal protein L33 [Gemmatimonadota bacterium]MDP7032237.1 50S ribosomal protein L33 [Gemmatimonadota bacterium]